MIAAFGFSFTTTMRMINRMIDPTSGTVTGWPAESAPVSGATKSTSGRKSSMACIAMPHIGASTEESEENCAVMAANQLMDYAERMTRLDAEIDDILHRLRGRPESIRRLSDASNLSVGVVWRLKATPDLAGLNFHIDVLRKMAAGLDRLDRDSSVGANHAA